MIDIALNVQNAKCAMSANSIAHSVFLIIFKGLIKCANERLNFSSHNRKYLFSNVFSNVRSVSLSGNVRGPPLARTSLQKPIFTSQGETYEN
jgi:hypothetical protein